MKFMKLVLSLFNANKLVLNHIFIFFFVLLSYEFIGVGVSNDSTDVICRKD